MNKSAATILAAKIVAVVAICSTLSSCELFCTCATVLLIDRGAQLQQQPTPMAGDALALFSWASLFEDCANGQDPKETDVCPSSGRWDVGPRINDDGTSQEEYVSCIPGTVDPLAPSLLAPEANEIPPDDSSGQNVVESTPSTLPRGAPRSHARRRPRSAGAADCTDPLNVGRGECAGTYRQNKPLATPQGE